jgi:hypothetical protein
MLQSMSFKEGEPPPERRLRRNSLGEEIDPDSILADSEYGPVFTEENILRISSILNAQVTRRYEEDRGYLNIWELQAKSFSLELTRFNNTAPFTVTGDAEVLYQGNREPACDTVRLRGVSWIGINPDELNYLRFVLEKKQYYSHLVIDRDTGLLEFRLEEKLRHRTPHNTSSSTGGL